MARRNRMTMLKRQRERKKAEKAEFKREQRAQRPHAEPGEGTSIASDDDLAGYGVTFPPERGEAG